MVFKLVTFAIRELRFHGCNEGLILNVNLYFLERWPPKFEYLKVRTINLYMVKSK